MENQMFENAPLMNMKKNPAGDRLRLTPTQSFWVVLTQIWFFLLGIGFMLIGGLRVAVEIVGGSLSDTLGEYINEDLFSIPSLIILAPIGLLGYGLVWGMAALGAKEPPAWRATRNLLVGILVAIIALIGLAVWSLGWVLPVLLGFGLMFGATGGLLSQLIKDEYRTVLGGVKNRTTPRRLVSVWTVGGGISVIAFAGLSLAYAIFTDIIELPLPTPEPNALLYITTFDNYNDEWTQEDDLQFSAEVLKDRYLRIEAPSGQPGLVLIANRPFDSFDLEMDVTLYSDSSEAVYGLIFRRQNEINYYVFEINGTGAYRFRKVVEGQETVISDWIVAQDADGKPLIRPFEVTRVRVLPVYERFYFFLEGSLAKLCLNPSGEACTPEQLQDSYTDYTYFPAGQLGFYAQGAAVGFDNLVIYDFSFDAYSPRASDILTLYQSNFDMRRVETELEVVSGIMTFETYPEGDARLVITVDSTRAQSEGQFSLLNRKLRDFDLRVTTTQIESDPDHLNIYGVMFRVRDEDNYYVFQMTGDGWYRLIKYGEDLPNGQETISTWIPTTNKNTFTSTDNYPTLIRPGEENIIQNTRGTMNQIRIVAQGDKFWFYVNGQHLKLCQKGENRESTFVSAGGSNRCDSDVLTDYYQDDAYKQGKVGFFVGYDVESDHDYPISIAFDNVLIVGPMTNHQPQAEALIFWRHYYD